MSELSLVGYRGPDSWTKDQNDDLMAERLIEIPPKEQDTVATIDDYDRWSIAPVYNPCSTLLQTANSAITRKQ